MPKSFQRKAFDNWLSKNRGLFRHPPVIITNRKQYFTMRFRDINSAIECTITSHDYTISVSNEGEYWDLTDTGDLSVQRTSSGHYFCEECETGHRELFPTRFALWKDHIFQPILDWANKNLLKTKWICLFQFGQGATMAQVVDENNLFTVMQDDSFVKAIPMTAHQVMPTQESNTVENKDANTTLRNIDAFKTLVSSLKKLEPD
jgi:hypothetical protein